MKYRPPLVGEQATDLPPRSGLRHRSPAVEAHRGSEDADIPQRIWFATPPPIEQLPVAAVPHINARATRRALSEAKVLLFLRICLLLRQVKLWWRSRCVH